MVRPTINTKTRIDMKVDPKLRLDVATLMETYGYTTITSLFTDLVNGLMLVTEEDGRPAKYMVFLVDRVFYETVKSKASKMGLSVREYVIRKIINDEN